ncbi:endoglucanase II [Verticillium dahliae]
MKSYVVAILASFASQAAAHSTFQQLWVDGVDYGSQCARLPPSNSPVEDVTSTNIVCNVGGTSGRGGKCPVKAGGTVTVEMHAQNGDRNCANEAIGGNHFGPVIVYLSKVSDASTADGSSGWFKIHEDGWSAKSGSAKADQDNWGVKDLNACCGRMDVRIPADLENGDYLLRAEVVALHVASQPKGAQFYMTCYQITIAGGTGANRPATVRFPGAYAATDPGILFNIYQATTSYKIPGPAVVSGGRSIVAGQGCKSGCEVTCKPGSGTTGTVVAPPAPTAGAPPAACSVPQFGQCGGQDYKGCTVCASPYTCKAVSPPYYSQCS